MALATAALVFRTLHVSSAAGASLALRLPSRSAVEAIAISRWWALGPAFPATVHAISTTTMASAIKTMLLSDGGRQQRRERSGNVQLSDGRLRATTESSLDFCPFARASALVCSATLGQTLLETTLQIETPYRPSKRKPPYCPVLTCAVHRTEGAFPPTRELRRPCRHR